MICEKCSKKILTANEFKSAVGQAYVQAITDMEFMKSLEERAKREE